MRFGRLPCSGHLNFSGSLRNIFFFKSRTRLLSLIRDLFLVIHSMVRGGAAVVQCGKCIAIFQAPQNDPFYCINAIFIDIMLQHNGIGASADPVDHILIDLIGGDSIGGIAAAYIPVKVPKSRLLHLLCQLGH